MDRLLRGRSTSLRMTSAKIPEQGPGQTTYFRFLKWAAQARPFARQWLEHVTNDTCDESDGIVERLAGRVGERDGLILQRDVF
jgi:hypothetical protein